MRGKGQPDKKPLTASAGHVKMRPDFLDATAELVSSPRSLVLLTTNLSWGFPGLGEALLGLSLALEGRCRRPGECTAEHGHEAEPVPV